MKLPDVMEQVENISFREDKTKPLHDSEFTNFSFGCDWVTFCETYPI